MRKRIIAGTIIFAGLLSVAVGLIASGLINSPPDGPEVVRARVQELQTLVTGEYEYRDVVYFDEETRVLGIRTGTQEMLFAVQIIVTAGIELGTELTVQTGGRRGREIFITVPEPQVLRVSAIESSIDQYFIREGFRGIDWLDVADEIEAAKTRNQTDAVERGLLDRSRVHAEFVLRNLLYAAGYDTVHVRFRPAARPGGGGLRG
ncbi:MAG: DUF4230 domain-containing protein [Spirochaeta sp.]|jgi:hypothetical protein|nr:DUF4230 domain-containing protein [Spirochaeta sp.]